MSDGELKERIFAVSRDRFLTDGFAKTSVDDIASNLGISKKTFYKVFRSKEDLVEQILEQILGQVRTNVERIVADEKDFIRKLGEVMRFIASTASLIGKPFARDVQRHLPHLWRKLEEFRRERVMQTFGALIHQGVTEGYVRPGVNNRIFLLAYLAAIEQIVRPNILMNESFSAKEAIVEIMTIFFAGVLTDEGRAHLAEIHRKELN